MKKDSKKTEKLVSSKSLLLEAQKFNLRPNEDIFDEGEWLLMFLLPKSTEDIDVLNRLFRVCRPSIVPQAFTEKNIGQLIVMEYYWSDNKIDWTCFYNLHEIVKYNTQGKFAIVSTEKD